MYSIIFYYNGTILFDLSKHHNDSSLHEDLHDAFKKCRAKLILARPELVESTKITHYHIDKQIDFLKLDNGYGVVHPDIRDNALSDAITSLKKEVTVILNNWSHAMNDPWLKEHIDKPHDGFWETEAYRLGHED